MVICQDGRVPSRKSAVLRAATALLAGALAVGMAGCVSAERPTDDATRYAAGHHRCVPGASVELDGPSHTFHLSGSCGEVVVRGDGVTARLQRAVSLDVQGQSSTVAVADRVGSAVVRGDGVSLSADSVGSVLITGQSNSVTAPALGSVMVQGDHNVITTHVHPSDYRVSGQDDRLLLQ